MFPVHGPPIPDGGNVPAETWTHSAGRKRKRVNGLETDACSGPYKPEGNKRRKDTSTLPDDLSSPKKIARKRKAAVAEDADDSKSCEEKRLRRFRNKPPQSYQEIKARALTQRLTIQDRERCGTEEVPEEKVLIAGSTGNLYTVQIGLVPSCNCPHALKGNQCKHIIYVMLRVLKAPENIAYQLALTSSELRELFKNAAPIPTADEGADSADGNRKPIEGECPICYTEFEPDKEAIVYCKASCGNNIHKECMENWMKARHGKATCPYCRSMWSENDFAGKKANLEGAVRSEEGYINIASQLGLSGERDYSTYHQPWVARRGSLRGYGSSRNYR